MHARLHAATLLTLVMGSACLALAGCASASVGTATIEIRQLPDDIAGEELEVQVRVGEGNSFKSLHMSTGMTIALDSVPFGNVEIEAVGVCAVASPIDELNPTTRLIVDGTHCTLAD